MATNNSTACTVGTIGVLIRGIRRKILTPQQVLKFLEDIPWKSTLYIKMSLLEQVVLKLKTEFNID